MVGIGLAELAIILGMLVMPIVAVVAVVVALMAVRRSQPPRVPVVRMPDPISSPVVVHLFSSFDHPVSRLAHWDGNELEVRADEPTTVSLFDLPLKNVEQCRLTFVCELRAPGFCSLLFPELWCRIPDRGFFFSRGVDRKIRGSTEWRTIELPFYLKPGQFADLLHLNLCFEGAGVARLRNIQVQSSPLPPW